MIKKTNPIRVHPGEVLQQILEEEGLSQAEFARYLHVDPSKVNEICRLRRGVSAEMAMKLAKALRFTSAETWLNLQKNWELSQVKPSVCDAVEPIRKQA